MATKYYEALNLSQVLTLIQAPNQALSQTLNKSPLPPLHPEALLKVYSKEELQQLERCGKKLNPQYISQTCDCQYCEALRYAGKALYSEELSPRKDEPTSFYDVTPGQIKTQKARGLRNILGQPSIVPGLKNPKLISDMPLLIPQMLKRAEKLHPKAFKGMFARPCPVVPRHGFVESRGINTLAEALDIYKNEVLPEDPNGELIIMPRLTGEYSFVATASGVSWGKGNAGVTDGDHAVLIPTQGLTEALRKHLTHWAYSPPDFMKDLTESPYLEGVEHEGEMQLVQVRNGPEQPHTVNYIPRTEPIKKVIYRYGSLLEWEEKLKSELQANGGKPDGLCVALELGSLASHYAVHAIQMGIAVATDFTPKKGEMLKAEPNVVPRLKNKDLRYLKGLISRLETQDFLCDSRSSYERADMQGRKPCAVPNAAATAFGTVHSMALWDNSPHLMQLRAYALTTLPRVILAACAGEMRHWYRNRAGYIHVNNDPETNMPALRAAFKGTKDWARYIEKKRAFSHGEGREPARPAQYDRDDVYIETIKPISLRNMSKHFDTMRRDFSVGNWHGGSYGGRAWQRVADGGYRLVRALLAFKKSPSNTTWNEVVVAANNAIHQVHNGGKVLNKWINDEFMTNCAYNPVIGFLNIFAGKIALGEPLTQQQQEKS